MIRIIFISLLLTLVYSWEEFKRMIGVFVYGLLRKKNHGYYAAHLDQMVSVLVMLATIPIGLTYLLAGEGDVFHKLATMPWHFW